MKTIRVLALLIVCIWFIISISSCAVTVRGDNGHHARHHHNETYTVYPGSSGGSHEKHNNPHNYNSTNPGKAKGSENNSNNPHHSDDKDKDKK